MSEEIKYSRRRFPGAAAMTFGAAKFGRSFSSKRLGRLSGLRRS
jgi:hypothetical protein